MKKILKIVLSVFMVMALVIQLPVDLISVVNAEDESNDFELVCTQTILYLGSSSNTGYIYIETDVENYSEEYVLSEEGIITQPEYLDDALYFEAISEGIVTITAIVTIDNVVVFEESVEITVVNYLNTIADGSSVDHNNSYCYFIYNVLSEEDKTIEIVEYYFDDDEFCAPETIDIPSTINGYTVKSIGEGAFIGCGDTWFITIPDTVTNIGYWAFIDCYSCTITIPASVTSIADEVFHVKMLNVYEDSYALQYAIDNDIDYTIIDSIPFTDVSSSQWYYNTVKEAYNLGLMTGTDETHFSPNKNMSRAMVVTVLYRMAGSPKISSTSSKFSDVKSGLWYTSAIIWATNLGIVSGYDNGKFGPEDNVTREQMAVMIRNYCQIYKKYSTSSTNDLTSFTDYKNVSSYAKTAVGWAVDKGIITGTTTKKLNPTSKATRAECAKMLLVASKLKS